MPAYDYRCTACDQCFEVNRPMGRSADEVCPSCGASAKRVFTPVGVAFKGSGFHNTDYRPRSSDDASAPACKTPAEGSSACANCPASKE